MHITVTYNLKRYNIIYHEGKKNKKKNKDIYIFIYLFTYMYVCVATCVHMPQVHNYKKQKYLFITIMVITVSTNNCWALLYFLNCTHFTEVKYTPHK